MRFPIVPSPRTVRLGVKNLLLHKLRSFLTMLGMIFGVASVVAMLAVGAGASTEALRKYEALGIQNILVKSVKPPETQDQSNQSRWTAQVYGLTYRDAKRIESTLTKIEEVVPVRRRKVQMSFEGQFFVSELIGVTPPFLNVIGLRVNDGVWLDELHLVERANVCVLGSEAARRLFPLRNPIDQLVRASGDVYRVVGVLDKLGRSGDDFGANIDSVVYIPFTTSQSYYGDLQVEVSGGSQKIENVELHQLNVRMQAPEQVVGAAAVIRKILAEEHAEEDYSVEVPLELLRQREAEALLFNFVLGTIAAISLLVGGIGIMNVMLATVTERTREIGIRRALGAKRGHVISQFLVETVILSGAGGLLGVAVGLGLSFLVEATTGRETIVHVEHPLLAFTISASVGVVFGIYPVWRAANMNPVDALRND